MEGGGWIPCFVWYMAFVLPFKQPLSQPMSFVPFAIFFLHPTVGIGRVESEQNASCGLVATGAKPRQRDSVLWPFPWKYKWWSRIFHGNPLESPCCYGLSVLSSRSGNLEDGLVFFYSVLVFWLHSSLCSPVVMCIHTDKTYFSYEDILEILYCIEKVFNTLPVYLPLV